MKSAAGLHGICIGMVLTARPIWIDWLGTAIPSLHPLSREIQCPHWPCARMIGGSAKLIGTYLLAQHFRDLRPAILLGELDKAQPRDLGIEIYLPTDELLHYLAIPGHDRKRCWGHAI